MTELNLNKKLNKTTVEELSLEERLVKVETVTLNLVFPGGEESQDELDPVKVKLLADLILENKISDKKRVLVKVRSTSSLENDQQTPPQESVVYEVIAGIRMAESLRSLGESEIDVVAIYRDEDFLISKADPEELYSLAEKGTLIKREEVFSVSNLLLSGELGKVIDGDHSNELGQDIIRNGQTNAITGGAVKVEDGTISLDITDGLHRGSIFQELGFETCKTMVVYGWSQEDIYFQRILAASSVRSVQFSRVTIWMQKAYALTQWSKEGFKLSQILTLAATDSSGKHLTNQGLKDAEGAKAWAHKMAYSFNAATNMEITSLQQKVKAAENSFTEVITKVRYASGGGKIGSGTFPPAKFISMVQEIPNDLERQLYVYELNKKHNFNAKTIALVSKAVKAINLKTDFKLLKGLKMNAVEVAGEILEQHEKGELKSNEDHEISQENTQAQPEDLKATPDVETSEKETFPHERKRMFSQQNTGSRRADYDKKDNSSKVATREVESLMATLKAVIKNGGGEEVAWLTNPEITLIEKEILSAWIVDIQPIEDIGYQLGLTQNKVSRLIGSAFQKMHLTRLDAKELKEARSVQEQKHTKIS